MATDAIIVIAALPTESKWVGIVQQGVVSEEGGVGTIICPLSVSFLWVICENDEVGADKVAEYGTQDYYIHLSPMLEMNESLVCAHIELRVHSCPSL